MTLLLAGTVAGEVATWTDRTGREAVTKMLAPAVAVEASVEVSVAVLARGIVAPAGKGESTVAATVRTSGPSPAGMAPRFQVTVRVPAA